MSDENQVNAEGLIDSSAEQAPVTGEVINNETNSDEQATSTNDETAGTTVDNTADATEEAPSADQQTTTTIEENSSTENAGEGSDASGTTKESTEDAVETVIPESKLDYAVYPSTDKTIIVLENDDYAGAHTYKIQNTKGFNNGVAELGEGFQELQFIQKNADGTIVEGVQSEQLAYILLDRVDKLSAVYPHVYADDMRRGLYIFLDACKKRIDERLSRNVMGELKK